MKPLVVYSERMILPGGLFRGYLTAENGTITGLSAERPVIGAVYLDAGPYYVSPGFIDLHTHGGGGYDFMDGSVDSITGGAAAHLAHGTTTMLPTTLACTEEELVLFLENFNAAKAMLKDGPYLYGAHLEGPYCNPAQAGALDPEHIKPPDRKEYERFVELGKGVIVRWSAAPELDGGLEFGDYLFANGILPSIAHSDAEYAQVREAFDHHYTMITHLYSGMSTIKRRSGFRVSGVIESGFIIEDIDVELIADGCHLPPEILKLVYRVKGPARIALVTDSMRGAGIENPEGSYNLGSLKSGRLAIIEDDVAKLPDRSALAGSVATADRLVRVMNKNAGIPVPDAVRMMTATPARIIGLQRQKGSIAAGMDCDLAVFDDDIRIKAVITGGALRCGSL